MESAAQRRREIEQAARSCGFDRLGIADASPPAEARLFTDWLSKGFQGRMQWLERGAAKRLDPSRVLPGVRSVVVGAVRYGPRAQPGGGPLSGRVSSYAWGDDYHLVVGERASRLARFIRERFSAQAVEYVDTGPVLERLWAARAGVGWIGKNAMVLNKDQGSWIFLAVVLTDLVLPADPPSLDQCGACTLCIEACPTAAIVSPRTVDSRLCLSYLTIEHRGHFPAAHREDAGDRAFGCDDCQTVCPWNAGEPSKEQAFAPRDENGAPDLADLAAMALPDYTRRFRRSSMKRATYHGLRRNAAVALGNLLAGGRGRIGQAGRGEWPPSAEDRRRALEVLRRLTEDAEPSVASAARAAMERSGLSASVDPEG